MTAGKLSQRQRTIALFLNLGTAWIVHRCISGRWTISGETSDAWVIAVAAYWLLGLVSAPYFRPPKDSLANGIGALIALSTISVSVSSAPASLLLALKGFGAILAISVVLLAVLAITALSAHRESSLSKFSYRLSNELGRGALLFTPVVLVSAFGGYAGDVTAILSVMILWTLTITIGISEIILRIPAEFMVKPKRLESVGFLGTVERFDSPGLVRVLLTGRAPWDTDGLCVLELSDRKQVLVIPLFEHPALEGRIGTGILAGETPDYLPNVRELEVHSYGNVDARNRLIGELSAFGEAGRLAGIVVEGSSIAALRFEAIGGDLAKGQIVSIRSRNEQVYYQITDAVTSEEALSSQVHGRRIATAIQLGEFVLDKGFVKYDWVPQMNTCVFLVPHDFKLQYTPKPDEYSFGVLPGTTCSVYADINEIVHYHAAVLGVTGTGKTELSLDLIRASVAQGCKVVCVDFTGEYAKRLADLNPLNLGLTADLGREYEEAIFAVETGNYGAGAEKAALKTFVDRIRPLIEGQVNSFLAGGDSLAILELAEITNTKATLRTTELFLSAFMSWAKAHRREKRILLVLEEAHTIVPETGGSGMDFESKWVVDRIGQIALQGRKYGIGLLVVSQRTALVSKTILSQCNTFFVFCLVDQTSLNFLTSVLSSEHVSGISNLQSLELVSYGRAISSERPLLVRRPYDAAKVLASARLDFAVDPQELYWLADFRLREWMQGAWPEWSEEVVDTPDQFAGTSRCPICMHDFLVIGHHDRPHCFYCDGSVDAEECENCGTTHLREYGCAYCNSSAAAE